MTNVAAVNMAIELFSSFLCLVFVLGILVGKDSLDRRDRTFILGAILNIAAMIGDGMGTLADGRSDGMDHLLNIVGHLIAYISTYFLLIVFSYYIHLFLLPRKAKRDPLLDVIYGVCCLGIVLIFLNLGIGFYYTIAADNSYRLGDWYWLSQMIGVAALALNGVAILRRRQELQRNEFLILLAFVIFPALAVMMQLMFLGTVTVWIASTITLILVFFGTLSRQGKLYREQQSAMQELQEQAHRLDETNHLLDSVNHMKTRLLSTVSHEMNTPLSVISANAQLSKALLKKGEIDPAVLTNLDLIADEAQRLSRLAKSIVKLSALQEAHDDQQWIEYRSLLQKTTTAYRPLLKKGVTLLLQVPEQLPSFQGDYDMLVQVLMNLLSNSLRYTAHGQIMVKAWVENDAVVTLVADSGSGIDPTLLPHVFERRVKDQISGNHGIGLTVCREIIQQHHGEMKINSKLDVGTCVTFSIPLVRERGINGE